MDPKYLPSKGFFKKVIIVGAFLVIIFVLYKTIPFLTQKYKQAKRNYEMKKVLVKDLVEKDSNSNGIPDWEESLWGLNPAKDGKENKAFIEEKRKALGYYDNQENSENLTLNDKIARELLVMIVTLKDSGNLNEGSINTISEALGAKIEAEELKDVYFKDNLEIVNTNTSTIKAYYSSFKSLVNKYENEDIGEEMTFISQAVQNNDLQALEITRNISESYRNFGKELMLIKVPNSLTNLHLSIANNYEKIGQSIEGMDKLLTDQLLGAGSIINYKKYQDELLLNLEKLEIFFRRNAIIK